jgi:hypothetical protein
MKKVIKLNENDIERLVKKIIKENDMDNSEEYPFDNEEEVEEDEDQLELEFPENEDEESEFDVEKYDDIFDGLFHQVIGTISEIEHTYPEEGKEYVDRLIQSFVKGLTSTDEYPDGYDPKFIQES